jgi:serine/threonine-protein kinase HipA
MAKALSVWMDGVRVAELRGGAGNSIRCAYSDEALERWPRNSPLISCSLPLGPRPLEASAFCKGLLPEGRALQTLADRARLATSDTFGLLARYGRDVAGALVISDEDLEERRFGVARYTPESLLEEVEDLEDHPLGAHDDSELSLAGLQDKLLLVQLEDGSWGRPLRGRPSTHILKVDNLRYPGLIEAEAHCLLLARAAGLSEIGIEIVTIGETRCLIVSRFDREVDGEEVRRIHQEDLLQALGIDPDGNQRRAKYETGGGPRLKNAAELLDSYAQDPPAQLDRLVAAATFTAVIGNADAHAKNVALLHHSPHDVELAPLYDTVPTALWPKLRPMAAMAIGGQVMLADVTMSDVVREAAVWPHPKDRAEQVARETAEALIQALEENVIPPDSPVAELVRNRTDAFLAS